MAALGVQKATAIAIRIDINNALGLELSRMFLGIFGGAEQHRLFRVPAGINNRARRPPPFGPHRAQCLGL